MNRKMKQIKSELNQSNKSLEDKNKELRKMKKDLGETPRQAMIREVGQELGLSKKILTI